MALVGSVFSSSPIPWEEVRNLGASDDPMSHELLLRIAAAAANPEERRQVLEAALARSRRLGFMRSSDLVRGWLRASSSAPLTEGDAAVALKVLNPAASDSLRAQMLEQGYQADKAAAAQLAAAVALDVRNIEMFRPLFSRAAGDFGRVSEIDQQATSAIMSAVPAIRALYLSDILDSSQLSPQDTQWLLARFREQGEPNVKLLVSHGLQNGTFVGPVKIFAEALAAQEPLSTRDRIVFLACLTSAPSKASAAALSTSYHPESPRALLALLWLSDDPEIRLAALDGLFAKPLGDPSLQRIADFVKSRKPEDRDHYSKVFAAAGLSDTLTDDEFSSGFALLHGRGVEPDLIAVLLQRAPSRVVFEVIESSGGTLQANVYLDLLKHPSKDVRLEALKRLQSFNDASMFALLRQMYDDERDEDVRRGYLNILGS